MKIIFISIAFLISMVSYSQVNTQVNLPDLIREIQIWEKDGNNMTLAFWIPTCYWEYSLKDSPQVPQETIDLLTSTFQDYVFVCALDLEMNMDGSMTFTDEKELTKTITIQDSIGNNYSPLETSQISGDIQLFMENFKPMFGQMLGQMGAGMQFYLFEIKDKEGHNMIDEFKTGRFTIKHSKKSFEFVLPLVTLMPNKICPVDGSEMKGNWNYCPIHGVELN